MTESPSSAVARAVGRVREDLRADPVLRIVLVLAAVLGGFWLWYRVPNTRVPDEFSRLLDPLAAIAYVAADPGLDSLRAGVTQGRVLGGSFYLAALAHAPALLALAVAGKFATIGGLVELGSRWEVWNALPEWYWTTTILAARGLNLAFALGSVYLVYRFGTAMRNRQTGRIAALLLTLSYGFLDAAHEFGENVPSLFCLLAVCCLAHHYAETGDRRAFLAGCAIGGFAIALKFTTGTAVFVLGAAFLLYARNAEDTPGALVAPRLIGAGAFLGAAAMLAGFPSVVVSGFEPLFERLAYSLTEKTADPATSVPSRPLWKWFRDGYTGGLSYPLVAAAGLGVLASLPTLRERSPEADGTILVLVALAVYWIAFSRWEYVKIAHLLPTFALLVLPTAAALSRLDARRPQVARVVVAVLVATSGLYAVAGVAQFADDPRDDVATWIEREVPENATMAASPSRSSVAWVPHGRNVENYVPPAVDGPFDRAYVRSYANYYQWLYETAEDRPDYVQGWRLVDGQRDEYTMVERADLGQPLYPLTWWLGGGPYPEQPGSAVVFERSDRCPESPTCSMNATESRAP